MKKEIILVEPHITLMEKREKIAVTILLIILPIVAAVEAYQHYHQLTYYWLIIGLVILLILLSVHKWNRFFLALSIIVQFIIAGSLIAYHMMMSMMKGIEIIVPEPPRWQYGLINFVDMFIIFLVLCHVAFITSHLMIRRRDFKAQRMSRRRRRELKKMQQADQLEQQA